MKTASAKRQIARFVELHETNIAQRVEVIVEHFRTTVTVAVSKQFFGWIMAINGDVRIVAPDSVVKQIREEIERQAEKYR